MIDTKTSQNDRQMTRQARVASLRQRIAAGTYEVCAETVAARMLAAKETPPSSFWVH